MRSKLSRLIAMGPARRRLLAEAMAGLLAARIWLLVVPFRRVAKQLGEATQAPAETPPGPGSGTAREIGWAVRSAARHAPFKAVCLQQAVAAKLMLRRRGLTGVLAFGVARPQDEEAMTAHAWLHAEGVEVTGYPVHPRFVHVASFI